MHKKKGNRNIQNKPNEETVDVYDVLYDVDYYYPDDLRFIKLA